MKKMNPIANHLECIFFSNPETKQPKSKASFYELLPLSLNPSALQKWNICYLSITCHKKKEKKSLALDLIIT